MAVSSIMILTGLALIVLGWKKIHKAAGLVKNGIYRYSRHPQYLGILLITSAFWNIKKKLQCLLKFLVLKYESEYL